MFDGVNADELSKEMSCQRRNMKKNNYDVAIIGGGMSGLMLAHRFIRSKSRFRCSNY